MKCHWKMKIKVKVNINDILRTVIQGGGQSLPNMKIIQWEENEMGL